MKIAFIANKESNHSKKWINFFRDNHEVFVLDLKGKKHKSLEIIFNIFKIRNQIKKINPDILHAHYAGVNGVLGALSGFHPFVITAWGSDILIAPKSILSRQLIKYALKKADMVTCDGDNSVEALIKLGVNKNKIRKIYFGVDTKKFFPDKKDDDLAKRLGVFGYPVVISLRNFEPVYDIETLLRAIPLVLKEIKETKFIIVGSGSQERYLKNMAKNMNENIRFIGAIENDKLPKYLNLADVYVSTSLSDGGISMSTTEAMACGLPVVVSDFGDNRKWVTDEKNGFVFPVKNPRILADKILYLLRNKDSREKLGKISREIIEEKNNYYTEMAKIENIYKLLSDK